MKTSLYSDRSLRRTRRFALSKAAEARQAKTLMRFSRLPRRPLVQRGQNRSQCRNERLLARVKSSRVVGLSIGVRVAAPAGGDGLHLSGVTPRLLLLPPARTASRDLECHPCDHRPRRQGGYIGAGQPDGGGEMSGDGWPTGPAPWKVQELWSYCPQCNAADAKILNRTADPTTMRRGHAVSCVREGVQPGRVGPRFPCHGHPDCAVSNTWLAGTYRQASDAKPLWLVLPASTTRLHCRIVS